MDQAKRGATHGEKLLLEVIGAGFGRTGTKSLQRALKILGVGPCYHFTEVLRRGHVGLWRRVAAGDLAVLPTILAGYRATTDWPAAAFHAELADDSPDARIILTVRDPDDWHRSITETIYRLRRALPDWLPIACGHARMTDAIIWHGTFDGRVEDRAHAVAVYEAHNTTVRRAYPAERLLVFDVREGWEPLCRFLRVAVPDGVPFPRSNEAWKFRLAARSLIIGKWLLPAAIVVASGWIFL